MNPPVPPNRVSLRDIAKKLGLSHSTISLGLRNHPRISPAVREKIHLAALEMGYRPDPMLAALAHYRNNRVGIPVHSAIGWINCWPRPQQLRTHHEFELYWRGASAVAEKFGYHLEEFAVGPEMNPDRLQEVLQTRGIQGLLLAPLPPGSSQNEWKSFDWDQFSIVRFGNSWMKPNTHCVTSDQVGNTILAVEKMRESGYRRIGFVRGSRFNSWSLYQAGYLVVQSELESEMRIPPCVIEDFISRESAAINLKAWIKKYKPDAILTDAAALPEILLKSGIRVPEDVGLVVESILDGNGDTGIDQNPEEIGRVACLMVMALINDNARGEPKILRKNLVSGNWVSGTMLPPRVSKIPALAEEILITK